MSSARLAPAEEQLSQPRRRLLRNLSRAALLLPAVALAACASRQPLPEEKRTRGRYGNRDRPGGGGRDR